MPVLIISEREDEGVKLGSLEIFPSPIDDTHSYLLLNY